MSTCRFLRVVVYGVVALAWIGGCSKVSSKSVERYDNAENVSVNETHHPQHSKYVIGSYFFGAYVKGVGETTTDGGPPFSVNIGAYALTAESNQIVIESAEVSIDGRARVDVLNQFSSVNFDAFDEPDQARFDESGSYESHWLHTGQFLKAYPSKDEGLVVYIKVRVGSGQGATVGELEFEFLPRVEDINAFRLPL